MVGTTPAITSTVAAELVSGRALQQVVKGVLAAGVGVHRRAVEAGGEEAIQRDWLRLRPGLQSLPANSSRAISVWRCRRPGRSAAKSAKMVKTTAAAAASPRR